VTVIDDPRGSGKSTSVAAGRITLLAQHLDATTRTVGAGEFLIGRGMLSGDLY
jgi:hypothetical protein